MSGGFLFSEGMSDFAHRVEHCHDVLRRDMCQDVMNLLKHEPATRKKNFHLFPYMLAHLFRCSLRQDCLGITPASPEYDITPEITL